jgi:hypothetical protein
MSEPGDYDRAARITMKLDPERFLRWMEPKLPAELVFTRWLDTRKIQFPAEQERICDTVAELCHREGMAVPWVLVAEAQTRPDPQFSERLLEYLARAARILRHGPHNRDRYLVGGARDLATAIIGRRATRA